MSASRNIKIADCSYEKIIRIAERCGFLVQEGRKHAKIKTRDDKFITAVPRHSRLKRETARAIVEALNAKGAAISYA